MSCKRDLQFGGDNGRVTAAPIMLVDVAFEKSEMANSGSGSGRRSVTEERKEGPSCEMQTALGWKH